MCINSGPNDERKVIHEREHVRGWCLRAKPQLVDIDIGMTERMNSRIVLIVGASVFCLHMM